jgi:hypothetical protein
VIPFSPFVVGFLSEGNAAVQAVERSSPADEETEQQEDGAGSEVAVCPLSKEDEEDDCDRKLEADAGESAEVELFVGRQWFSGHLSFVPGGNLGACERFHKRWLDWADYTVCLRKRGKTEGMPNKWLRCK